ncbi:Uncharacterised protein [uncultured archaeon]|nr:Uncharacterised protein [uncultured archaeon]
MGLRFLGGLTVSYGAGSSDAWLIKTDSNGTEQWNKTFGGTNWDYAKSVQQTLGGGYVLSGDTGSYGAGTAWLIKTDSNGNQQWNMTFGGGGYETTNSVQQTVDGGYVLAGWTELYDGDRGDGWLIKVSADTGAPQGNIGYSALVATGQNTYIQSSNGSFGLLLKGQTKTINNSVILNNTGDLSAKVEARFNDSIGGVYGLISGANVLNATNFALGFPSALVSLDNNGSDVQVAVAPPGVTALNARLGVPNEQVAGDYGGTVILTFSNSV